MKEVAEEWERYFTCLGENTENSINFKIEKEVKRIYKNEKKNKKPYLPDYNLLTAQDLLQAHDQIFAIILLKDFIKLNVNTNTMIINVKLAELNTRIVRDFLKTQTLKVI